MTPDEHSAELDAILARLRDRVDRIGGGVTGRRPHLRIAGDEPVDERPDAIVVPFPSDRRR
jgi:hypothetical protein